MRRLQRLIRLVATAGLLVLGAAGLTGHLVGEDHCLLMGYEEGTLTSNDVRWAPPGIACVVLAPSGNAPDGRFVYADPPRRVARGSWPAFLVTLAIGAGLLIMANRRRSALPAWLRLTAATALAMTVAGVGAFFGGVLGASFLGVVVGVPVAVAADRSARRGTPAGVPFVAEAVTGVVAFLALVLGWIGWSYDLGLAGYAAALVLVAAVAALPWRRVSPATPRAR